MEDKKAARKAVARHSPVFMFGLGGSAAGSSPPFGQRETVTGNHICGKKCMTGLSAAPPEGDLEKVGAEE